MSRQAIIPWRMDIAARPPILEQSWRQSYGWEGPGAEYQWFPADEWPSSGGKPPRREPHIERIQSPQVSFYHQYFIDMEEAHKRANDRTLQELEDDIGFYFAIYAIINLLVSVGFLALGFFSSALGG